MITDIEHYSNFRCAMESFIAEFLTIVMSNYVPDRSRASLKLPVKKNYSCKLKSVERHFPLPVNCADADLGITMLLGSSHLPKSLCEVQ